MVGGHAGQFLVHEPENVAFDDVHDRFPRFGLFFGDRGPKNTFPVFGAAITAVEPLLFRRLLCLRLNPNQPNG